MAVTIQSCCSSALEIHTGWQNKENKQQLWEAPKANQAKQSFKEETFSATVVSKQLGSAVWRRQEKGTRNSVFPRRVTDVTLYLVEGKLRRRRSGTKEWSKTAKGQKAVMGEKQTEEYQSETRWGVFGWTNWEAASHNCTCQPDWRGITTPPPN